MPRGTLDRYYHVLGVDRSCSAAELKQAYRDLAQVWHPDRFMTNPRLRKTAEHKLREINRAYAALCGLRASAADPVSSGTATIATSAAPPGMTIRPTSTQRRLSPALSGAGVAAVVFALIVGVLSVHRGLEQPSHADGPANLPPPAPQPQQTAPSPAMHRGRPVKEIALPPLANGEELIVPRGRSGIGRVMIANRTERDTVAMLCSGDSSATALRMIYVHAGKQASIDGIAPGLYRLRLSTGTHWNWHARDFTRNRTRPQSVGPLSFTQIQSSGETRGDAYTIVLRGEGPAPETKAGGENRLRT